MEAIISDDADLLALLRKAPDKLVVCSRARSTFCLRMQPIQSARVTRVLAWIAREGSNNKLGGDALFCMGLDEAEDVSRDWVVRFDGTQQHGLSDRNGHVP
jgi:hypothetical protein